MTVTSLPQESSNLEWTPPPDPDFEQLAADGIAAFRRDRPTVVAFDTETSGFEWFDEAFCVTAAWRGRPKRVAIGTGPGPKNVLGDNDAVYTYSNWKKVQQDGIMVGAYFELDMFDASAEAREVLEAPTLLGHNIKFDLHRARNLGLLTQTQIDRAVLHDSEAMAHLDDEHRLKALKVLAVTVLGIEDTIRIPIKSKPGEFKEMPREKWELENAKKWAKKEYGLASVTDVGYNILPRGTIVPYAIKDAEFTLDLARMLYPKIKQYDDLLGLYKQEMAATRVFLDLEAEGLGVDEVYVKQQINEYMKKIMTVEDSIGKIVGKEVKTGKVPPKQRSLYFNPQSNDEIAKFFRANGFNRPNYDAEQMESIKHPMAAAILELRSYQKILGTYFMALKKSTRNGVFHPSIRQHGTVTGRTSSGGAKGD